MGASSHQLPDAPPRRRWRIELERGARLLQRGQRDQARACFARAYALAPGEPEAALALGREEHRRGRLTEAERLLEQAWQARPKWPLAACALARLLLDRGALERVGRVLEPALAAAPRHPALLLVSGELHLASDRPDEAAASFHAAREAGACQRAVDAGLARVENARGLTLAAAGADTEAAFAFKRAADLDRAWAPPEVNLGALLHRLGRPSAARVRYRRALALDPKNGVAWFDLGLLCRDQGELAAAERAFAAALAADPPHPRARRELAVTLAEKGEHARSAELLEEELRSTRRADPWVFTQLGLAFVALRQPARAEAALRQALALDEEHPQALAHLARLLHHEGRLVEAAALVRRAWNRTPPAASK